MLCMQLCFCNDFVFWLMDEGEKKPNSYLYIVLEYCCR